MRDGQEQSFEAGLNLKTETGRWETADKGLRQSEVADDVSRGGQEVREPTQAKEESREETVNSEECTRRWRHRPIDCNVRL